MSWEQTITTAPYNTINLPGGYEPDFSNPQEKTYMIPNIYYEQNKYSQPIKKIQKHDNFSNIDPTSNGENLHNNDFHDPTIEQVNEYLKTNKSMYDNRGKYYDQYLFNQKFDEYIQQKNKERLLKEKVRLYDLDRISNIEIAPYQLPINKLLINLKNVWFNFFDNIINLNNPFENFTTTNFFYYGITLVTIYLLIIMLSYIFD